MKTKSSPRLLEQFTELCYDMCKLGFYFVKKVSAYSRDTSDPVSGGSVYFTNAYNSLLNIYVSVDENINKDKFATYEVCYYVADAINLTEVYTTSDIEKVNVKLNEIKEIIMSTRFAIAPVLQSKYNLKEVL